MNEARRHAKKRKPKICWSQHRRPELVRRRDVTPEEFDALSINRKYPPKLFNARDEPFRCGTMMLRVAEFVGPPRPSLETKHRGYPLTNFQRKRLQNSQNHRYFMRRVRPHHKKSNQLLRSATKLTGAYAPAS